MFRRIIAFSLAHRGLVVGAAALLVVYGGIVLASLPVDVFPDLNRPTVTVMTEVPGLAPEEIEPRVTFLIESAMGGLPGVERVRSQTAAGLSVVYVEFDWGTEIYRDRQLVAEKLGLLREALPAGVTPAMGPVTSIMGEILLVGVVGDEKTSDMLLRSTADWVIRPRLLTVRGVSQVIAIGGARQELHVRARPSDLVKNRISIRDLEQAVADANRASGGGVLATGSREWVVRNLGRVAGPEELAASVLTTREGRSLRIGDVADVAWEGPVAPRGTAGVGAKSGVILSVQKQPGADTVEVSRGVDEALVELRAALPAGVRVNPELFRQERFIRASISNLEEALRDGAILVTIVLFLFLLNFRTTFITLTAIPLSFVTALLVFKAFGIGINTMTLGGFAVAIGELVDDAIVDLENVFRRLRENRALPQPRPFLRVVLDASNEVRSSIVLATVAVILVFLPLFAMSGIEGRLFQPLGIAYIVAILGSLVVSLTLTPVLASLLLPNAKVTATTRDAWLVRGLKAADRGVLSVTLGHPRLVALVTLLVLGGAVLLYVGMGSEFLPPFNEGTATVNVLARPGISIEASSAMGRKAEELLLALPEVASVGRRTGRAEMDEHAEGVHSTEIDVDFKPGKGTRSELLERVRRALADLPGVNVSVGQPIAHRLDHLLSGVRAQVAVKVFGPELGRLRGYAETVRQVAQGLKGVRDLQVEKQVLVPQVRVEVRRADLERSGVRAGDVVDLLETARAGRTVTEVVEGNRSFPVVVLLQGGEASGAEDLRRLPVSLPSGAQVLLRDLADVTETQGPNQVQRENGERRIAVSFNVEGRDLGSVVGELRARLAAEVEPHFTTGYRLTIGGQFESQEAAAKRILWLGLLSLALIFFILYGHFRSVGAVVQILLNVPFALIGSVVAVWLTGRVVSIAHLVGFVSLTGIAARNGIMMISHYCHLVTEEGESFTPTMIVRGSLERLVPVLMTAITAMLGLVPVALSAGQPGKEILYPVAVVILGGLVSSTLLDILVTPAVFRWTGRRTIDAALARKQSAEATHALA